MGAASLYIWLYVLCGLFVVALVILGVVLSRMGKGTERAGHVTRIDGDGDDKG